MQTVAQLYSAQFSPDGKQVFISALISLRRFRMLIYQYLAEATIELTQPELHLYHRKHAELLACLDNELTSPPDKQLAMASALMYVSRLRAGVFETLAPENICEPETDRIRNYYQLIKST